MKSLFKKIFRRTTVTRTIFFIFSDTFLILFSVYLSFLLRFEAKIPNEQFSNLQSLAVLVLLFSLPAFHFFRLYSFSWSYVSTEELLALFKATSLSFLLSGVTFLIFENSPWFINFPRSTLFISYFLLFLFCGGIRFSKRIYIRLFRKGIEKERTRTLIVGAGDAGEQLLRSIQALKSSPYLPVGYIDDNPIKQGVSIHGLKVLGKISDIPEVVGDNQIEEMIIAIPSAGSKTIRAAVEMGRKAGLKKIKVVPSIGEIINGEVSITNIRDVQVEDLLGREAVSLDLKSIESFIKDKAVLVTGAAGSIGSELSRQIAKFYPSLLLILDQDETGIFNISRRLRQKFSRLNIFSIIADIQDKRKISQVFNKYHPTVVFHAAAYKHVPLMELHPDEAVKNNIFGTKILAEASLENGVEKFVFISTDKAVNPTSVMGATKRAGEMICQALNQRNATKFISVRFGNVLDSRGSVVPIFRDQIKRGGPVEVTHPDMKRYFMTIPEACLLVMQAGAMSAGGEIFVLDMGKPIPILDLAKEMIKLSGFEPDKDIPIVFTGSRPGERLFENILTAEEGTIATQNQKIFIAKLTNINEQKLDSSLKRLKEALRSDGEIIKTILKELIPSYRSVED
jgi:FlaA1/EpsC-like NDP-sugar epimerase